MFQHIYLLYINVQNIYTYYIYFYPSYFIDSCGHIGCGRRANLPALGGGHSKHHFHIMQGNTTTSSDEDATKKKRPKIFRRILRSSSKSSIAAAAEEAAKNDKIDCVVCIDIVSKAVHCYLCDDYVLTDSDWLAKLRKELSEIEFKRNFEDGLVYPIAHSTSTDVDDDYEMVDQYPNSKLKSEGLKEEEKDSSPPPSPSLSPVSSFRKGITGLDNLGNTCYMNSVLQLLSHCSGFTAFFREFLRSAAPVRLAGEGGYTLSRQTTTRLKDELHKDQTPDELALTEATHALLRVLWSGRWKSIQPRAFVNAVWKHSILFAARKQQDANEFLNFYLGRLDDELKNPKATTSVMLDLFGIEQYQEVECDECKTISKKVEPLLGLVLSIPDEVEPDDETMSEAFTSIHLTDCFKSLQASGRFIEDNKFECDVCQEKKDASWRVTLQRRPQSLLISFRRTLWNKKKGLHKDSRKIVFPLELDASNLLGVGNEKTPDSDFDGCHYSLQAVVSHSGSSPLVGHYICYGRVGDDWYLFNDSHVSPATESNVLEVEAFILLYERRTIPSIDE